MLQFNILVIRNESVEFDKDKLKQSLEELITLSKYKKKSTIEEAPYFTDCLTAIAYIFKQSAKKLPVYYIGDMPRMLIKVHRWKLLKVKEDELHDGDLIFVKNKHTKRFVSHVALAANGALFHSSQQGVKKETPKAFFEPYLQPYFSDGSLLERFIDSRNIKCRTINKGIFLS